MWAWKCPCGEKFKANTLEQVQERKQRHQSSHSARNRAMFRREPPEGWHPGFNC